MLLQVENLTKAYRTFHQGRLRNPGWEQGKLQVLPDWMPFSNSLKIAYGDFYALRNLNLTLEPGEVFGLLGPNGSGKTTAIRTMMGFLQPTEGSARINGHDCWQDGVAARRYVSYLPGELRLYERMTGTEIIRFLSEMRGQPVSDKLPALIERFEIDVNRPLAQMSSGMKRKVALLQMLVLQAPLIIMDEPTNTLDPNMRQELLHQVQLAKENGQTVLFSSHVLSEVEKVCDRVGILQKGRLVHLQEMSELMEGRVIQVRFRDQVPSLPTIEGLSVRSQNSQTIVLEHLGKLPHLFDWLGQQSLEDLRMEPLGLSSTYHRYHGAQE